MATKSCQGLLKNTLIKAHTHSVALLIACRPLVLSDLPVVSLPLLMAPVFYYGMHPVSWFILFANITITIIEWQFLTRQFFKNLQLQKEEESKPETTPAS